MNVNENLKYIPACALAGDTAKLADMRQRLSQKLKDGQVVTIGQNGRLDPKGSTVIPDGIFANPEDTQLSQVRQRLAQKLRKQFAEELKQAQPSDASTFSKDGAADDYFAQMQRTMRQRLVQKLKQAQPSDASTFSNDGAADDYTIPITLPINISPGPDDPDCLLEKTD